MVWVDVVTDPLYVHKGWFLRCFVTQMVVRNTWGSVGGWVDAGVVDV